MTKKHFKALAATIAIMANRKEAENACENLARICAQSNPRFNESMFRRACGFSE